MPRETTVPLELFGRDHWSTFAYIACVVTGRDGIPDKDRMRTDRDRHPGLVGPTVARLESKTKYPTRLAKGLERHEHDDWDCADDLETIGLIKQVGTGMNPKFILTELGWKVFKDLTEFKDKKGGSFATYQCNIPIPAVLV
jgi:hypothetical protein